jgi:hypothetical protein
MFEKASALELREDAFCVDSDALSASVLGALDGGDDPRPSE